MGYYTYFNLEARPVNNNNAEDIRTCIKKLTARLDELCVFEEMWTEQDETVLLCCGDSKWYDWEADMRTISAEFPELVFHMHGDGEGVEDLWEAHFLSGKMQFCPATFAPYDPRKMT